MLSAFLIAVFLAGSVAAEDYSPRYVENSAFGPGERLVFSVEYGIIKAGTATMSVTGPEAYEGLMAYRISASARSNPAFSAFFSVNDLNEALLDIVQLHTLHYYKRLEEGDYVHSEEVLFDQEAGTATYPGEEDPEEQICEIPPHALDVLSCLYYSRTLPLVVGETYTFECHTDNDNYPMEVNVLRTERIRVPAGTFDCILVEPELRGEAVFAQQGEILVWLTNDSRHMPVLMRSEIDIGEIACLLQSYTDGTVLEVPDPFAELQ
jgi:hypothetical protein